MPLGWLRSGGAGEVTTDVKERCQPEELAFSPIAVVNFLREAKLWYSRGLETVAIGEEFDLDGVPSTHRWRRNRTCDQGRHTDFNWRSKCCCLSMDQRLSGTHSQT